MASNVITTYRADQVGSFLRPKAILDARERGDKAQLREIEDREILRILAKQKELGFEIFTDGELRRKSFMSDFNEAVEGLDEGDAVARMWSGSTMPVTGVVTSKIRQKQRLTKHELDFLRKHSPGPIKMTLPSANQFPAISYKKGISERAYPDAAEFLKDVVGIMAREAGALAEEGVAYLQIDAPRYSYYLDPKWQEFLRKEFGDLGTLLDEAIAADNASFRAARKPGVVRAIHLCRGNNRSQWYAEGGYDAIAEKLFGQLEVERFLLEYDDARSGSFAPLRFVPQDKTVVLGLISTKNAALEDADAIARRIDEATKYIPLERLALSPQCGFASTMLGNELSEDDQWRKLQLVVDVARKVWGA